MKDVDPFFIFYVQMSVDTVMGVSCLFCVVLDKPNRMVKPVMACQQTEADYVKQ